MGREEWGQDYSTAPILLQSHRVPAGEATVSQLDTVAASSGGGPGERLRWD